MYVILRQFKYDKIRYSYYFKSFQYPKRISKHKVLEKNAYPWREYKPQDIFFEIL